MGTTRIKVIDLSGEQKEIKTSRKHAEKLSGLGKLKEEKKVKETKVAQEQQVPPATEAPAVESAAAKEQTGTVPVSKTPKPPAVARPPSTHVEGVVGQAKKTTHHKGKKYQQARSLVDRNKTYKISEALDLLAKSSYTKFDPTVEVHMSVTDKNLSGKVNFPHAVGGKIKERRYLIFSDKQSLSSSRVRLGAGLKKTITEGTEKEQKAQKDKTAKTINNIIWANEKTITDIEEGKLKPGRDFDAVIAGPKFMPQLATIAKILGPAGMMPNPKNGTITDNPTDLIEKRKIAGFEYRTDPTAPIIHTQIGKLSFKPIQLEENLKTLVAAIVPTKIRKATIKSTMSPGIKVDINTLA